MKFMMEIDPEVNPDAVGEYLRSAFFNEQNQPATFGMIQAGNEPYRQMGCYSTFDWQDDVEPLEEILQEESTCKACRGAGVISAGGGTPSYDYVCTCTEKECWTRGRKLVCTTGEPVSIECRYWWDGDGTLIFHLPGGKYLINTDCKKDHDWYLTNDPKEF